MTEKPKIQYIGQFYVPGSEAQVLAPKKKKKKAKTKLPIAKQEQVKAIYIDPVALIGITVAVVMLAVMVVARRTEGYTCGIIASLAAVLAVNYAFAEPYFEFSLSLPGYPLSFLCFLAVAMIISAMTTRIKQQEERSYRAQLEEMRANLLRAVSHDLRTPLTSIAGAANLLLQTPDMTAEELF